MVRTLGLLLPYLTFVALGDYSLDGVEEEETCLLQAAVKLVEADSGVVLAVAASAGTNISGSRHDADKRRRVEQNTSASFASMEQGELATSQPSEPGHLFNYFACGLVGYAALALVYDQHRSSKEGGEGGKQRALEWDGIKLFVQVLIVAYHIQLWLAINQDDFNPSHGIRAMALYPDQAAASISHLYSFKEWLLFDYDGAFRMSAFAFISGVFGQKVDKDTLLRVICYTYGTSCMCKLLSVVYQLIFFRQAWGISGTLWYLVCLFWWRITLSPTFDKLKDQSLMLRVFVYVLITASLFACYDLFGQSIDTFRQSTSLMLSWFIPESNYFILAPFFACGLILPSRQWTELLRNKTLQTAAVLTLMLLCVAMTNSAYKEWCRRSMIFLHWPLFPDASQALNARRIGRHFFWLAYKGIFTWAALWSVAALTAILQALAPSLTQRVLSAGERTMYSYVLHQYFICMASDVFHVRSFLNGLTSPQFSWVVFASALFLVLILTSRLTEKLLHRMVMPFWLLDVFTFFGRKPKELL